eukprot:TRINITY_DN5825_c0_g1_i1.p1 TRINITY_DN5825_c0_g1~~TRINITY_DN5825_c0_g1_i1.p1  ORF type:complete len:445 (+),score=85.78 TRINITY_DN5825_c0_g1_i1:73-1407(+)
MTVRTKRTHLCALLALCFLQFASVAFAGIERFHVTMDDRNKFYVGRFGFREGGEGHITISDYRFYKKGNLLHNPPRIGFMIKKSDSDVSGFLEQNVEVACLYDKLEPQDMEISIYQNHTAGESYDIKSMRYSYTIQPGHEALHTFFFVNCEPESRVSYKMSLVAFNPGPVYLSYGEEPLPTLYFVYSLLYVGAFGVWVQYLRSPTKKVFKIHYIMAVLVIVKFLAILFQSITLHYIKDKGDSSGWNVPFYIFDFMKGILLFVVIILIGTGWTLMKSFFSDRDKKLFMFVLPLQIVANTAMVIIEETAPGSEGWVAWFNLLRFIDIICCGAVLFPIIWSIKHLREGSETDGKAAKNLEKLTLFRQFYIMVVSYIYFTRIIKYLLDATLPYEYIWLSTFFTELATLVFYSLTGYLFRPVQNNPYLRVDSDDEGDVQMVDLQPDAQA